MGGLRGGGGGAHGAINRAIAAGRLATVAAVVPPYDPSTDPSVWLWLDASDQDSFNGGAGEAQISGWLDKGSQQNNCFQFTSSQQPSIAMAAHNGLGCLRFSSPFGLGQNLVGSSSVQDCTLFVVGSAGGPSMCWVDFYSDPPYVEAVSLRVDSSGLVVVDRGTDQLVGPPLPSGLSLWSVICGGSSSMLYLGGSLVAGDSTALDLVLSGNYSVGWSVSGGSAPFVGDLCEILAYPSVLLAPDRLRVEGYLARKWGLS